jgi:hypothetical protein
MFSHLIEIGKITTCDLKSYRLIILFEKKQVHHCPLYLSKIMLLKRARLGAATWKKGHIFHLIFNKTNKVSICNQTRFAE